jgi:hypothetical protein
MIINQFRPELGGLGLVGLFSFVSYPPITTHRPDIDPGQQKREYPYPIGNPDCYYDGHAADWPQLPVGFLQVSRECAAGQWRCPSHGSLSPAFAAISVRSFGGTQRAGDNHPFNLRSSPPQPRDNGPKGISQNAALWNAQRRNKDHVGRIGPSHQPFACSLPCPLPF